VSSGVSGERVWKALRSSMTAENVVDAARFGIVAGIIAYSACLLAAPKFIAGETETMGQHILGVLGVCNIVLWVLGISSFLGAL